MSAGFYLALEGIEGSGKSTVSGLLADRLEADGRSRVTVREPGGTELGEEVRRLLLHSGHVSAWAEAALFAAARAQLVAEVVGPALEAGSVVVSDRTYYSSLAYQGHARGLGVDVVRTLNETVLDGYRPDLVAVIDVDPEVGLARQRTVDRIGGEGIEFQRLVRQGYLELAAAEPERVVVVDGSLPPDRIADVIAGFVP